MKATMGAAGAQRRVTAEDLRHWASRLRILSIRATTEAGSGHPTSCASAADIVATLFFAVMQRDDDGAYIDDFVLSKGHAAPLLYAAWAVAGAIPEERLLGLRKIDSDLEGHPTPRLPFVEVATGSLGQGLSAGFGMALDAKRLHRSDRRTYVLLGDGECAEGSVWEAAEVASHYGMDNLCATVDINRLGQSEPTMLQHDIAAYDARWRAFGWETFVVDGHDCEQLWNAYRQAAATPGRPSVILARTRKGEGIPGIVDENGHHGKALKREDAEAAIKQLRRNLVDPPPSWRAAPLPRRESPPAGSASGILADPPYSPDSQPLATRKAFGAALAELGRRRPDVVALDGDVKNSSYTGLFEEAAPERFFQMYIAEQNMIGVAMGLAAKGWTPFAATFACFLTRAYDLIRMAAISGSNIKLVGSHCGVSIGEDGPSQMGLEDLAMFRAEPDFTILYPSDAVSAWRATSLLAERRGPAYLRTTRPSTPVLYGPSEQFAIGKCKVVRRHPDDRVTIAGAGVTLFEALKAHDQLVKEGIHARVIDLFSVQPLDVATILDALRATQGRLVSVEDHYSRGGIGEALCAAAAAEGVPLLARCLAVSRIPRSGSSQELLELCGISARRIVHAVKSIL